MEAYKEYLFVYIYNQDYNTIEEIDERASKDPRFTINRNEEGKIHSRYLGDRYEPAIIYESNNLGCSHYYLFDGDIKDCTHPFCIDYLNGIIVGVTYYSSERIKNKEPIYITCNISYYNTINCLKILDEYDAGTFTKIHTFENFTLVCDEMEEPFAFKFAD